MKREIIDPEFPLTVEENAAACILVGWTADDALRCSLDLKNELAAQPKPREDEEGWFAGGPRIRVIGEDLRAALYLVARVHAGDDVVSDTARDAWLEQWTVRVSEAEAKRRLDQLDRLGAAWSAHRDTFHRLLTRGTL